MLGSSRVITTNSGAVCYDADLTPFGAERAYTNTCPQNVYKFEGKERDAETGNDDFDARYYSNRFGRWLSADWSSVPVPVPYANLSNPQTLNLYAMVSDDPESFADLDGHDIIYDDGLENAQLVKDSVQAILSDPNTSANLAGYVGPNNPNLTIKSGDLSAGDTSTSSPDGQTVTTTTVQGETDASALQESTLTENGVTSSPSVSGSATITIDNRTSKSDTPAVLVHESVHAKEARANPIQFGKEATAEKSLPHDQRPQEKRANAAQAAYGLEIKRRVKVIEQNRKKQQHQEQ